MRRNKSVSNVFVSYDVKIYIYDTLRKLLFKLCCDIEILDSSSAASLEDIYITENTAESPHILILKIRAVAPFENKQGNSVYADVRKLRDIKFACHMADLAVTYEFAVDPEIET